MTHSAFMDPAAPPTEPQVIAAIGEVAPLWRELVNRLTREIGAKSTFRWDGRNYGWSLPFTRAGRSFVTLTPQSGGMQALVVLGRHEADMARALPLNGLTRAIFEASPQLHDGRWLFLSIGSHDDLDDLLKLLTVKLPPRVRVRVADALLAPVAG
jgi:hypothetical protein